MKSASIYFRESDLVIRPEWHYRGGGSTSGEPVETIPRDASPEDVGKAVRRALSHSRNDFEGWSDWETKNAKRLGKEKVGLWRDLARDSVLCAVQETEGVIRVNPTRKDVGTSEDNIGFCHLVERGEEKDSNIPDAELATLLFAVARRCMTTSPDQVLDIDLETGSTHKTLRLEDIRALSDSIECTVVLNSKGFQARRRVVISELGGKIEELERMHSKQKGVVRLQEAGCDDFIVLECTKEGQVNITGQFVEHARISQRLEFGFETDRACLGPLIRDLKKF